MEQETASTDLKGFSRGAPHTLKSSFSSFPNKSSLALKQNETKPKQNRKERQERQRSQVNDDKWRETLVRDHVRPPLIIKRGSCIFFVQRFLDLNVASGRAAIRA